MSPIYASHQRHQVGNIIGNKLTLQQTPVFPGRVERAPRQFPFMPVYSDAGDAGYVGDISPYNFTYVPLTVTVPPTSTMISASARTEPIECLSINH